MVNISELFAIDKPYAIPDRDVVDFLSPFRWGPVITDGNKADFCKAASSYDIGEHLRVKSCIVKRPVSAEERQWEHAAAKDRYYDRVDGVGYWRGEWNRTALARWDKGEIGKDAWWNMCLYAEGEEKRLKRIAMAYYVWECEAIDALPSRL